MMSGKIYLIQGDETLQALQETAYQNEDLLQSLLEKYPELLAGEQIDEAIPRRWLLVAREIGFPDADDGGQRMALDHLFLDQEGVPTLVEVKRSSDTRIRREVVGQMLDYAANAVAFWPVEVIQQIFMDNCKAAEKEPDQEIQALIQADVDDETAVSKFWQQVKTNLQAGKIRMIFVADAIPPQLRRIVEFLNEQMDPGEVLAVELPQFVSESGLRTIVPRVIGQTSEAQQKKGGPRTRNKWDEASFFAKLQATGKAHEINAARQILAWADKHVSYIWWGEGNQIGSFVPILLHQEQKYQLFALYTNGYLEIYFQWLQLKPPFDSEEKRLELLQKLNEIPGVTIPQDAITRRPSIHLQTLSNQAKVQQLVNIFDWVVAEITR